VTAGGLFNVPFELFEDLIERIDIGQADLDAFENFRVFNAFGHALMVVFA